MRRPSPLPIAVNASTDVTPGRGTSSTVNRAFPQPSNGKVAVKAINHYGDDVLKVYES